MGRISPANSPQPGQNASLYSAGAGIGSSLSGATQSGGLLAIDSCKQ